MTPPPDRPGVLTAALAQQLASLGLVRYPPDSPGAALPCYVEVAPSAPDDCVTLFSRAGFPSDDLDGYETPEIQAIVRTAPGTSVRVGYGTAEAIRRGIAREGGTATYPTTWAPSTPDTAAVLRADANEPQPLALGADQIGRLRWSVSWQIETLTSEVAV